MSIAVLEGVVVAAMLVAIESFMVPLLQKRLGASASIIGFLAIVPMIGSSITGLMVGPLIRAMGGNKRCVLITCAVQILALLGLSIPIHFPEQPWAVPTALALAISIGLIGSIGGPAWLSWMGSLVPRRLQGRYLSHRNRLHILVKLSVAAAFAQIVSALPENQGPWGLQIVFAAGALSRTVSMWMISRQHDPAPRPKLGSHDSQQLAASGGMLTFLRTIFRTDLGRWTAVWASLHIGVMISGPYAAVYTLTKVDEGGLELGPWPYIFLMQTAQVTRLAVFPFVGRLIDLFGPSAMLRVAVVGIMMIPLPWALATRLPVLIATEIASGLCWCVAEVAVNVLLFSCHRDPAHRARLIGYHQTVVNVIAALSAGFGSLLLAKHASGGTEGNLLPPIGGSSFHTLFLLSMVMRMPAVVVAARLLPRLRELRDDEHAGLWRMIPGTELAQSMSRGLMARFRR